MVSRMPRWTGRSWAVKLNSCSSRPQIWSTSGTWRWYRMEYAEKFPVTSILYHRHVPEVVQDGVRRKVPGDLAEAGLEAGLASRAADTGFGVADDAGGAIDHAGLYQGTERQIGGGGVTARVGNEARGRDEVAAKLGQSVDRLGQQFRPGVGFLIPSRVVLGRAQAEGAAEIHHTGARGQHDGRQFHGNLRGGGQEYNGKSFLVYGIAGTGDAGRRLRAANRRSAAGVLPMIHEDWLHVRVAIEETDQLRATVTSIADNSDPFHV